MSPEIVEKLIKYLRYHISDCYIPDYNPEAEETTKFSITIPTNSVHGVEFAVKIAEISWKSGIFVVTQFPNNTAYSDTLLTILAYFNPNE